MRRLLALGVESEMNDLTVAARAWIEGDPDPATRQALAAALDRGDTAELHRAVGAALEFGTAGIRGEVGPGSARMNRAVVIRTTAGLAATLAARHPSPGPVVVGYDARPTSKRFAEDAVGVLAAAGIPVLVFPEPAPTPLVAFAARELVAVAAIVITASHNPPADNGYKVYAENAAQIIPPYDTEIAAAISAVGAANRVGRVEDPMAHALVEPVTGILDRYWEQVNQSRPSPRRGRRPVVYTPLHGVAGATVVEVFARAGHEGLDPVPEQFAPDGTFPTVAFPNPEEPGSLDLALARADSTGASLVLANDPDGDRFAAAVRGERGWRRLTGNEMAALLADAVLRGWTHPQTPILTGSVVSSPMVARLARLRRAHHETTLTGFKWIINAGLALEGEGVGRFAFGYEEALGYSVGGTVRDKDGISAALVFMDLATAAEEDGETVIHRLHRLWDECGMWASAQFNIAGPIEQLTAAVARFAADPPEEVGGTGVEELIDYRTGEGDRPPWMGAQDLVELRLRDEGRVLVRPSGTEPKLKIYVDLVDDPGPAPDSSQRRLASRAEAVARAVGEGLKP